MSAHTLGPWDGERDEDGDITYPDGSFRRRCGCYWPADWPLVSRIYCTMDAPREPPHATTVEVEG